MRDPETGFADSTRCTKSVAAPALDTLAALAYTAGSIALSVEAATVPPCDPASWFCNRASEQGLLAASAVQAGLGAAIETGAAVYGFRNVDDCNAGRVRSNERDSGRRMIRIEVVSDESNLPPYSTVDEEEPFKDDESSPNDVDFGVNDDELDWDE